MDKEEISYRLTWLCIDSIENLTPLQLFYDTKDFDEEIVLEILARVDYDAYVWDSIKTAYSFCHSDKVIDRIMGKILPPYYHKVEAIICSKRYLYEKEDDCDPLDEELPTKQQSQVYLQQSRGEIQSAFATLQDMIVRHFGHVDILNNDTVESLTRKLEQKESECKKLVELIEEYASIAEQLRDIISYNNKTIDKLNREIERQQKIIQKLKKNAGSREEAKLRAENERLRQEQEAWRERPEYKAEIAKYEKASKHNISVKQLKEGLYGIVNTYGNEEQLTNFILRLNQMLKNTAWDAEANGILNEALAMQAQKMISQKQAGHSDTAKALRDTAAVMTDIVNQPRVGTMIMEQNNHALSPDDAVMVADKERHLELPANNSRRGRKRRNN